MLHFVLQPLSKSVSLLFGVGKVAYVEFITGALTSCLQELMRAFTFN